MTIFKSGSGGQGRSFSYHPNLKVRVQVIGKTWVVNVSNVKCVHLVKFLCYDRLTV